MSRPGLRNPEGAVRALGAITLIMEGVVLLLAIQPIRVLDRGFSAAPVTAACVLAVAAVTLGGLLRRGWAWPAGGALQVILIICGLLHWSLAVIGVVFGAAWLYAVHVRRTILG